MAGLGFVDEPWGTRETGEHEFHERDKATPIELREAGKAQQWVALRDPPGQGDGRLAERSGNCKT